MKKSNRSIFEYICFCFTDDFDTNTKELNLFYEKIKSIVQTKFRDNYELNNKFEDFFAIKDIEFIHSKLAIFITYIIVMVFPVGILAFTVRKKGLVQIQRKFNPVVYSCKLGV